MSHTAHNLPQIIVAGHICLDIIPTFEGKADAAMFAPGSLTRIGQAMCSTGGAVANVGLALNRLGVGVKLLARIGADMFGRQIVQIVNEAGEGLAAGLHEVPGENSSYSIVISPPGRDRFFLHCPGANDTFSAADVTANLLAGARMFHFGYPPVMKRISQENGRQLRAIFDLAQQSRLATSLDMCSVDPASEAGKVNWRTYLENVLPAVDLFLPSLDELRYMLGKPASTAAPTIAELSALSDVLLDMGAAVAVIKLGEHGLYVRTSANHSRLNKCPVIGPDRAKAWTDQQVIAPCFSVNVAGTTGAGDCTIAGFLAAVLKGQSPADAATSAVAVGACSVGKPDAVSGILPWDQVQARIASRWNRHAATVK